MIESSSRLEADPTTGRATRPAVALAALVFLLITFLPSAAFGGQAASGELFFYPCTSCHPVTMIPGTDQPSKPLPNKFMKHEIGLIGHDQLGAGDAACLACHDDPSRDPGKLKLADGSLIDVKGDVAQVCFRCHSEKYREWKAGTHGRHKDKCTASGCHDPHTPGFIYAEPLRPFVGNGFQFQVLAKRAAFTPLMSPPLPPPVLEIRWFTYMVAVGLVIAGGLVGTLIFGRLKR